MTGTKDPFEAAIDDLRALMVSFQENEWSELHLDDSRGEIFIARADGGPNPLFDAVPVGRDDGAADLRAATVKMHDVVAPHIATVTSVLSRGSTVAAGDESAVLSVLDEAMPLCAPVAGEIADVFVSAGELVEYGALLFRIRVDS